MATAISTSSPRQTHGRSSRIRRMLAAGLLPYLGKRLLILVLTLFFIYCMMFALLRLAPGDPVAKMLPEQASAEMKEKLRESLGLNRPIIEQFGLQLAGFLVGDFGLTNDGRNVAERISERIFPTLILVAPSILLSILVGIYFGRIIAWKRRGFLDNSLTFVGLIFYTMFTYWLAILMIRIFATNLNWFFDGEMNESKFIAYPQDPSAWPLDTAPSLWGYLMQSAPNQTLRLVIDTAYHAILPTLTYFLHFFAYYMLYMRTSMLEVLQDDYVNTAKAKGVPDWAVKKFHVSRNAMLPVITLVVLSASSLIGGSVLIESVFDWPGLGQLVFTGIKDNEYNLTQAAVIFLSSLVLLGTLVADVLYTAFDPRVRLKD